MGHIIIIIYIAALLLGGSVSLILFRLRRLNPELFLRPLFRYTLLFNFVILIAFSTNYAQTNIPVPYDQRVLSVVLWIFINNFGGFFALAGLLFAFPAVFRGFQGRPPSRVLDRILLVVAAVFAVGYVAGFVSFLYRLPNYWLDASRNVFNGLSLLFLWGTAVFHWFERPKAPCVIDRAAVRLFAGFYLAGFSLFLVPILLRSRYTMLLLSFWILVLSAIPLFWLKFGYRRGRRAEALDGLGGAGLEEIAAKHGLSSREKDVLTYLLQGRSNSEIGEALFISIGTVKNHVTVIFRKLGIARRGQLMGFIRGKRP